MIYPYPLAPVTAVLTYTGAETGGMSPIILKVAWYGMCLIFVPCALICKPKMLRNAGLACIQFTKVLMVTVTGPFGRGTDPAYAIVPRHMPAHCPVLNTSHCIGLYTQSTRPVSTRPVKILITYC